MWNGILAAAVSVMQIAAVLFIENKYEEQKKENKTGKRWLVYSIISVLTVVLNMQLFRQESYSPLMLLNFVAISTVVLTTGVIDFYCHKIPNLVLAIGAGSRVFLLLMTLFFERPEFLTQLLMSLAGCIASLLVMLLISIVSKQGIGYGDVKMYACIGLYLGIMDTYYILFYAVLLAALYAAYVLLAKKGDRKTRIPFGPFTHLGFVLVYLFSFM